MPKPSPLRRLVARLKEAGVSFPNGEPDRAHYCCRGQEPNTWLSREVTYLSGRSQISQYVDWRLHRGGDLCAMGSEIILYDKVSFLAGDRCLLLARRGDDHQVEVMGLDSFAHLRQLSIPERALAIHWLGEPDILAARYVHLGKQDGSYAAICVASHGVPDGARTHQDIRGAGADPLLTLAPLNGTIELLTRRLSEVELRECLV